MIENILLAEDDENLRESLKLILENSGFKVHDARDGQEAIKILQHETFDAIILDDHLPYIHGSDLLGLIKMKNPEVKVIIMSGLLDDSVKEKITQQDVDWFLEKPFEFAVLLRYLKDPP